MGGHEQIYLTGRLNLSFKVRLQLSAHIDFSTIIMSPGTEGLKCLMCSKTNRTEESTRVCLSCSSTHHVCKCEDEHRSVTHTPAHTHTHTHAFTYTSTAVLSSRVTPCPWLQIAQRGGGNHQGKRDPLSCCHCVTVIYSLQNLMKLCISLVEGSREKKGHMSSSLSHEWIN